MPVFAPLARPSYDPFGPLSGYDRNIRLPNQGEPVRSRLASSVYPVLDVCMDAYYASLSRSFQGDIEFSHHVEVVRELIHEGADVDVRDDTSGGSCLHFAAGSGSLQLCKSLLGAKARTSARDLRLQTPLWWAIAGNHLEVCRLLLSVDQVLTANINQLTALHEAAFLGRAEILELLLQRGNDELSRNRFGPERLPAGPNWRAGRGLVSPLHLACRRGHFYAAAVLLKYGADVLLTCSKGRTALHYACSGRGGKVLELCHLLLQQKPSLLNLRDAFGQTAAQVAASRGFMPPELRLLLGRSGCFQKTRDGHGLRART
ncbi:unnamed protein product [Effrenium voratum]|nr:unnamed protein product [Effrenium voratum]